MKPTQIFNGIVVLILIVAIGFASLWIWQWQNERKVLQQIIERLSADSRVAEILVTKSEFDEISKKIKTTIKFLEYDAFGKPLEPKYFAFQGNIIQFQSLVIRFKEKFVEAGDRLRGKSAFLFMKAFVLDGPRTQEFVITSVDEIPSGYKIPGLQSEYEKKIWAEFWRYVTDDKARDEAGIKNAQIEAPGSLFLPGTVYTLRIEHDGGLRIDAEPVPNILKGETVS